MTYRQTGNDLSDQIQFETERRLNDLEAKVSTLGPKGTVTMVIGTEPSSTSIPPGVTSAAPVSKDTALAMQWFVSGTTLTASLAASADIPPPRCEVTFLLF